MDIKFIFGFHKKSKSLKMKHVFLFIALSCSFLTFGQTPSTSEWLVSAGVNTINNIATQSPFNSPDEWAFKTPFSFGVEKILDNRFGIDLNLSFNGYSQGDKRDSTTSDGTYDYFSFDPSVKYYFGDIIFKDDSPFHLYGMAGPGFYFIDENNVTINVGGGLLVWLNNNHSFGIKLQSLAKFALDSKDDKYDDDHFQYHLQLVFGL